MVDLKEFPTSVYLEKYDVHVRRYLTLAQIQNIVKAVKSLDMWSERQQNIDLLVLVYAAGIDPKKIEELGHDILLESGLIDAVKAKIVNYDDIERAIDYTESVQRGVAQILKELPKIAKQLDTRTLKGVKDALIPSKK